MKKYPEITLSQKVNEDIFLELSNRVKSEFGGKLINEVADIDSAYKDFDVNGKKLTLHQQVFIGIVIFPTLLEEAKKEECILAEKIGFALKD